MVLLAATGRHLQTLQASTGRVPIKAAMDRMTAEGVGSHRRGCPAALRLAGASLLPQQQGLCCQEGPPAPAVPTLQTATEHAQA
jgi:hypothetical protein